MKKLIPIFALALLACSCEKITMEESTIAIDAQNPRIEAYRDHYIKYLHEWYGPDEILDTYLERLETELNDGKLRLVGMDDDPDYTLILRSLEVSEYVAIRVCKRHDVSNLVTIGMFDLIDETDSLPIETWNLSDEHEDSVNDDCRLNRSGGVGGAFTAHARKIRRRVKWTIRGYD